MDLIIMLYTVFSFMISFCILSDLSNGLGDALTQIIKFMSTRNLFGKIYCVIAMLIISPAQGMAYTFYYVYKLLIAIYHLGEKRDYRE